MYRQVRYRDAFSAFWLLQEAELSMRPVTGYQYVYTYFYLRSYVASTILVGLATYVGLGCGADRSDYDITIPHFLNDTGVKAFCSLGPPGGGPFGRPLLLHHLAT